MRTTASRIALILGAALVWPLASSAQVMIGDTVDLKFIGNDPSATNVTVKFGGTPTTLTGRAGVYLFEGSNSTSNPPGLLNLDLDLFCVELSQTVTQGQTNNYEVRPIFEAGKNGDDPPSPLAGIGLDRALNLQLLFGNVFGTAYDPSILNNDQKVGFSLAVWELSHDTDYNLGSGAPPGFQVTSAPANALTFGQGLIDAVKLDRDTNDLSGQLTLLVLHNPTEQDQLLPGFGGFAIPEPSTYAAFALGLTCLGAIGLRRLRSA